jgi:hypothetical protein
MANFRPDFLPIFYKVVKNSAGASQTTKNQFVKESESQGTKARLILNGLWHEYEVM